MDINNIDISELLHREDGRVVYKGAEGIIATRGDGEVLLTDIEDGKALCSILRDPALPAFRLVVVKSPAVCESLVRELGFSYEQPCSQWVYTGSEPPACGDADIRPLPAELAALAGRHYHPEGNTEPYILDRIAAGRIWGLFESGQLAGFIGMHDEGAMGILEILPEYRRKGYGCALEAFLIAWHLQRGFVPYCHVYDDNEISLRLQEKLGLVRAPKPVIWLWKE